MKKSARFSFTTLCQTVTTYSNPLYFGILKHTRGLFFFFFFLIYLMTLCPSWYLYLQRYEYDHKLWIWKNIEGSDRGLFKFIISKFVGGLEEIKNILSQNNRYMIEIRRGRIPNTGVSRVWKLLTLRVTELIIFNCISIHNEVTFFCESMLILTVRLSLDR
jgi:hypothetical protein